MSARRSPLLYFPRSGAESWDLQLKPAQLRRMMLEHGVTIRSLAREHGISKKRTREVLAKGVGGLLAETWHKFITGKWPCEVKA